MFTYEAQAKAPALKCLPLMALCGQWDGEAGWPGVGYTPIPVASLKL